MLAEEREVEVVSPAVHFHHELEMRGQVGGCGRSLHTFIRAIL